MKIIIPMTGYGSRFKAAGYKDLKPLIKVQGMPIIEWIVKYIYPGESNFLFVCRKEHIKNIPEMMRTLQRIAPEGEIFTIDDWVKLGPVYDVLRASDSIPDIEPCIINYCDFFMIWNYEQFKRDVMSRGCDGAVPCYSGFHPNLIPKKNLYASCRTDPDDNLIEIREKYSFEVDKTKSKHSPGVYYFKSGSILKKYCQQMIDAKDSLNGEFYASLPFNYLVKDGRKVWAPTNVEYFCQWGTPEDMEEYLFWTNTILSGELSK